MSFTPYKAAALAILLPALTLAASFGGLALSTEVGVSTYGLSNVPAAFSCALDLGYRLDEVAFTLGYFAEPFAEMGGAQGPRLLVYYFTNPASQLFMRLGGGVDYFWRLAPFNESADAQSPQVRRLWAGELGIRVGIKFLGVLDAFVDAALIFPVGERVGLSVRTVFGLGYQL
ncbi:MAG: hypothetical protein NTW26_10450 [bacterium]|nr:hypothetical protein [bacterium]